MGSGKTLVPFLAITILSFIKHRAVLHKDCVKLNDLQKGKIWGLSHATGCVIENEGNHFSEIKQ